MDDLNEFDRSVAALMGNKMAQESKQLWYMVERAKITAAKSPKPSIAMIAELKRKLK